jgi:hypothetical protein
MSALIRSRNSSPAALGGGEAVDRGLVLLQHPECLAALRDNRDVTAHDLRRVGAVRGCVRAQVISASIWPK